MTSKVEWQVVDMGEEVITNIKAALERVLNERKDPAHKEPYDLSNPKRTPKRGDFIMTHDLTMKEYNNHLGLVCETGLTNVPGGSPLCLIEINIPYSDTAVKRTKVHMFEKKLWFLPSPKSPSTGAAPSLFNSLARSNESSVIVSPLAVAAAGAGAVAAAGAGAKAPAPPSAPRPPSSSLSANSSVAAGAGAKAPAPPSAPRPPRSANSVAAGTANPLAAALAASRKKGGRRRRNKRKTRRHRK